jgi:hypothetical protein
MKYLRYAAGITTIIIALLQEDMNTLKKKLMQDDTSENVGLPNIHKYEEEMFSIVKSESWVKANVDFRKISLNLKQSNRFEIHYNIDKDGTRMYTRINCFSNG